MWIKFECKPTFWPTCHKGDLLAGAAVAIKVGADNAGSVILSTSQAFDQAVGVPWIATVRIPIFIHSNGIVGYSTSARRPVNSGRVLAAVDYCSDIVRRAGNWREGKGLCSSQNNRASHVSVSQRSQYIPVWATSPNTLLVEQLSLEATINILRCSPHGTPVTSQLSSEEVQL